MKIYDTLTGFIGIGGIQATNLISDENNQVLQLILQVVIALFTIWKLVKKKKSINDKSK